MLSGQYEDDVDNSDEIVYTGQGGNDLLGNKRQIKDQVMHLGNLALKVRHLDYGSYSFDCARIIGDMIFFSQQICLKFSFYKKCWMYFLQSQVEIYSCNRNNVFAMCLRIWIENRK